MDGGQQWSSQEAGGKLRKEENKRTQLHIRYVQHLEHEVQKTGPPLAHGLPGGLRLREELGTKAHGIFLETMGDLRGMFQSTQCKSWG